MYFKISKYKDEIILYATNEQLEKRWSVVTPEKMEEITGQKWSWFHSIQRTDNDKRKMERTRLTLGYDDRVGRPVIVKTLQYIPTDLESIESVNRKRDVLFQQIKLLNDISSPLLPEPLDWFHVENTVDAFPLEELSASEPVLILDYLPGKSLDFTIKSKQFRRYIDKSIDIPKIARFMSTILYFLKTLYEKDYMYMGLTPDHILLLKDEIPRFIGLGRICPIKNGFLDNTHVNFGRTKKGYSAPELNVPETDFGKYANPQAIGAFSLGVILAQILMEEVELQDDILENGAFKYPNYRYEQTIKQLPKGDLLHNLLVKLCDSNPSTRLKDFDEIERLLQIISGDSVLPPRVEPVQLLKNRTGKVKFYDSNKGFGYIIDLKSSDEYYINQQTLSENNINCLYDNDSVIFDLKKDNKGYFIVKINRKPNPEKTPPKKTPPKKTPPKKTPPKKTPPKKTPPQSPQTSDKKDGWCFISTAAYGSTMSPKLDILRWFRDNVLKQYTLGRKLLAHYFITSPKISHKLRGMDIRKAIVRNLINLAIPAIEKIQKSQKNTFNYYAYSTLAVIIYYVAYCVAYLFVLPERLLNIETTKSRGEDE